MNRFTFFARAAVRISATAVALGTVLSGCSATGAVNALVPHAGYELQSGIAYGSAPRQQLDVYRPQAAAAPGPLVVFFYGGTWSHGDRADYRFVGEALAARGAVVVVPDYRLSPQVTYPAFLQDSALAVRWAFDHAAALGADPARIVLMGHSAGAYNAAELALDARWLAAVGLTPSQLSAWIGLAGPYNFLPIGDPETRVAFGWPDTPADSQPIAHAGTRGPRTLLLAAERDTYVDPERNTAALATALQASGTDVTVRRYGRVNHVTLVGSLATPLRFLAPARQDILAFLGLVPPAP